jgi:hypothetical protein
MSPGSGAVILTGPAWPSGAFLDSDETGVRRIAEFGRWRGSAAPRVGHTYLPGESWSDIEGPGWIIDPWAKWHVSKPGSLLVLNVPMLTPNEARLSDEQVARLLRRGIGGEFDKHFQTLAERLIGSGASKTILVLGWEMNGVTYVSRCRPDREAWKQYWRRIVSVIRDVPGGAFRFEFTPSRGVDAIPWTECYPGDDVVDIIGMNTYDQPPGASFGEYVSQPYGLQDHIEFAAHRHKPISYSEWGLSRHGDNPDFIQGMHNWFTAHPVVYETVTDYCPHGVWECADRHPESAARYRNLFGSNIN